MVSIVITHGRSQEFGIGETIETSWTQALRQGLGEAQAPYAQSIPVDFAFYGGLWRPDAADYTARETERERGAIETERGAFEDERGDEEEPTDLQVAIAKDLLAAAPAAERGEVERLGWDTIASLVGNLDDILGVGKLTIKVFLKDIDRYFKDDALRAQAIAKVVDTVHANPAPVVLMAHSLGTVVAYDALRRNPDLPVPGLVTFGSPLGLATVRARLEETGGPLVFPPSVRFWANISEDRDFVSAGIELAPLYTSDDGRRVDDRRSVGRRPGVTDLVAAHDAIVYLSSAALATATRDMVDALSPQSAMANGDEAASPERGTTRGIPGFTQERQEAERSPDGGFRSVEATGDGQPQRIHPATDDGDDTVAAAPPDFSMAAPPPAADVTDAEPATREVKRAAAASFPPLVAPGAVETLSFQIGAPGMVTGDATADVVTSVPVTMETLKLTVAVQAPDFDVVDGQGNLASVATSVSLDLTNESALITGSFQLRARETTQPLQTDVRLRILHDNNPVATITLPTLIASIRETAPERAAQRAGSILLRASPAPGAQLTLYINDRDGDEKFEITANFKGDVGVRPMYYLDSFPVKQGAWEFSRTILDHFRAVRDKPADERQGRMNALGAALWQELPEKFRNFYWENVHGKVTTILLCSDEPYIPWELIVPQGGPGGETAPMLGLAYQMGRWEDERDLPGAPLVVTDFVVIAPAYQDSPLPSADLEANDLVARFGARREQPGNRAQVTGMFLANTPQILHFSGHGTFEDVGANSRIALADAVLDTFDLGTATFAERDHPPLVFLNACEVGEQGWSLTKIGGWAEAFCQKGATGFVGPYWPVADGVAHKAALIFYRSLQTGETVGEAMIKIRRRFAEDDKYPYHPSWLAYSLHCHPNLRVELAGQSPNGV